MKLILVSSAGHLGGGERNLLDIAAYFKAKAHDVQAIIPSAGRLVEALSAQGIPFLKIAMPFYPQPVAILRLRSWFKQSHPDIVHAHGTKAALFARLASVGLKVPIVYTMHGIHYLDYRNPLKRWIFVLFERLLVPLTDRFVCVCQRNLDEGKTARVIDADKTALIYNGVDSQPPDLRVRTRKELGVGAEVVILNIGRLQAIKGQAYLIEAAARAKKRKDKIKIWIVGEGAEEERLRQAITRNQLGEMVSLLGYREDTRPLLAAADVFVLPSLREGFPYTVLEAMAFQKPVVATDVGGIPEAVVEGETGFIVPPADADALAGKIIYLVENPEVGKAMGEAGAERVAERFSLNEMLRQYQKLYDGLLVRDRPKYPEDESGER